MKACAKCGVEKPRSEFHRRGAARDGLNSACKACRKLEGAAYYVANADEIMARNSAWRKSNPQKVKACHDAYNASYYAANREKETARVAAYQAKNPEKVAAGNAAWAKANPEKARAKTMARKARKLRATPVWADQRGIELWYTGSQIMTKIMGRPYHVDHIVPLRSKLVCGLHAHTNMQLLPGDENMSKSNRYWPDMP